MYISEKVLFDKSIKNADDAKLQMLLNNLQILVSECLDPEASDSMVAGTLTGGLCALAEIVSQHLKNCHQE